MFPHKSCLVTFRFKNVMFDISPTEEVGDFYVKAKFMGVEMEKVQLNFQVNTSTLLQMWADDLLKQILMTDG